MKLIFGMLIALCVLNGCATATPAPNRLSTPLYQISATPFVVTPAPVGATFVATSAANAPSATPGVAAPPNSVELQPTETPTVFPTPFSGTLALVARSSFRTSCDYDDPFGLASKGFDPVAFLPTGDCFNGEIGLFKIGDKTYIAQSGLFDAAYTLTEVTNPAVPQIIGIWGLGQETHTLDIKPFRQGDKYYLGLALQRSRQQQDLPCGIVIVDVTNVQQPKLVTTLNGRVVGAPDPWCNVHTFEVDTDAQGNANYLIVSDVDTFSARAVDIRDLQAPREVNFYHLHAHPHTAPNQPVLNYVHDSYVAPDKIYLAYWLAGVVILDKGKFEAGMPQDPVIIKPIGNVAPGGFHVHLATPLGNAFLMIQDELNADNGLRLLDIRDPKNPKTVWVETNPGGVNAPHNFVIRDNLIFVGWYNDGIKVYQYDIRNPDKPSVNLFAYQEVRANKNVTRERYFDGVWGVRIDECTLANAKRTCVFASDMSTGLIVLALKP